MEIIFFQTLDGQKTKKWLTFKDTIGDLPKAVPAQEKNRANQNLEIPNHKYMNGSFSLMYMSRNRRRCWDEPSFTIQDGGRHAPLHPSSCEMMKVEKDLWKFKGNNPIFRRLSVREAARIQTFSDNFIFYYNNIANGYKMIGNAVPVKLAQAIAQKIKHDLSLNSFIE